MKSTNNNTFINTVNYICTIKNMTYFESGSIREYGFNDYIKFMNRTVSL
ncbi:hypothetical protein [Clostridium tepidum]|nr:hypothetical protein [Clostridium tepidum]MDU6879157.1 hypothetical protein [Clostridium botulinum]